MSREVSEFIVVAPASQAKAVEWAERRLLSYLAGHFPHYQFRIEPFGPLSDEHQFTIVPIMNRPPAPEEDVSDLDELFMCRLDPQAIPEINRVLQAFDLVGTTIH